MNGPTGPNDNTLFFPRNTGLYESRLRGRKFCVDTVRGGESKTSNGSSVYTYREKTFIGVSHWLDGMVSPSPPLLPLFQSSEKNENKNEKLPRQGFELL